MPFRLKKEHTWLPRLSSQLTLPIPQPIAKGTPSLGYPLPWSVYTWLEGEPANACLIDDSEAFALAVARFLVELRRADKTGAPAAGAHNFHRGAALRVYDTETRTALKQLSGRVDTTVALAVWESAIWSIWGGDNVWVHGDMSSGNLLVKDGKLHAVIDFGCSAVGDPACDLVVAWTMFDEPSRHTFQCAVAVDDATWRRGKGWALWKALITMANAQEQQHKVDEAHQVIRRILADQR